MKLFGFSLSCPAGQIVAFNLKKLYFLKPYLLGWASLDLGASVGSREGAKGLLDGFCGIAGTNAAYFVAPKTPKDP